MRRSMPLLMAAVFALLAVPPLLSFVRAATDSTFSPFPAPVMASTSVALAALAVAWFLVARTERRVLRWLIVAGTVFGLFVGAYGLVGTASLMDDCAATQATAMIASSFPEGYCDRIGGSLMIGFYMIGVGLASLISIVAGWWMGQTDPALD